MAACCHQRWYSTEKETIVRHDAWAERIEGETGLKRWGRRLRPNHKALTLAPHTGAVRTRVDS